MTNIMENTSNDETININDMDNRDDISLSLSVLSVKTYSSFSTIESNESIFCRICHERDNSDIENPQMISPCNCMGSMANVHQQCLQRWASMASTSNCDICGFNYNCRKKYPPVVKWIKEVMTNKEFTVELVITALMTISTPLIIMATILSSLVRYSEMNDPMKALIYGLWGITLFSWILFLIMLFCTSRYLYKSFIKWRNKNTTVELVWSENTPVDKTFENYI